MYEPSKLFDPTPVVEAWRQVLLDAAEYIRVHGHCKGEGIARDGRVCSIGAIFSVADTDSTWLAQHHLAAYLRRSGEFIVSFNDAPERTADEVIAALRAAAVAP